MAAFQQASDDGSRFVSEVFVPIRQERTSREEPSAWDEIHERMERRRKEWDDEVTNLRKDFFRMRSDDPASTGGQTSLTAAAELNNMFFIGPDGQKVFRVSFDVSQFDPSEINVRTADQRIIVHAKHEEAGGDKRVSREFSRQVDIPHNVNPLSLRSTLNCDGLLVLEANVTGVANLKQHPYYHYPQHQPQQQPQPASCKTFGVHSSTPSSAHCETDGLQVFRIVVDIGAEFEPNDLLVKTVERKLIVHARHEERAPGRTSCREFDREFDLPDAVDPQTVSAGMSSDGKLIIEAPISSFSQGSFSGKPGSSKQPTLTVSFTPQSN